MTRSDNTLLSVTELASTLRVYEGPDHPVPPPQTFRRRRRRSLVLVGVAAAVLGIGGIAAAEGVGPFAWIGAADHPSTTSDIPTGTIVAKIRQLNSDWLKNTAGGQLLVDTTRLVATLESGRRIYVVATTTGSLCVLEQDAPGHSSSWGIGCGQPLSNSQPTTVETIRISEEMPPLTFGVARDDVVAVSFTAGGTIKTVPIINNVWVYEGASSALRSLTVHYRDGTTSVLGRG